MQYQELHQRYGTYIAKRVQTGLHASEFNQVEIEELTSYLELRAAAAHKEYHLRLDDPFSKNQLGTGSSGVIDLLHRRWREAEELAYLLMIAEDVGTHARLNLAVG